MSRHTQIIFFSSFLFFAIPVVGFAQSTISGVIQDLQIQVPLEFASIAIYSESDSSLVNGSISDVAGQFQIDGINSGSYFIKVSFIGYTTKVLTSIPLKKNEALNLGIITLEPDQTLLDAVDVEGQKIATDFQLQKQSYAAENFQASQGGNAADILKNLPGASINVDGEISIQGEDSRFYTPSIVFKKTWMDGRMSANLIWQNIDMGLLETNEQRITTYQEGEFFTTTNYIQEVDMIILNFSYTLNRSKNKAKFVNSEFAEKKF